MTDKPKVCPKCEHQMTQGHYLGRTLSAWFAEKSVPTEAELKLML